MLVMMLRAVGTRESCPGVTEERMLQVTTDEGETGCFPWKILRWQFYSS